MGVKANQLEIEETEYRGSIEIKFAESGMVLPEVIITGKVLPRDILSLQPFLTRAFRIFMNRQKVNPKEIETNTPEEN